MVLKNKKGQDLSIGTLILIVLGIVVLVILILGFSLGWQNLWEKINIFGGGSSLGDVATACNLAANQDNKFSYCQDLKRVKVDGKIEYLNCEDPRLQASIDKKLDCTGADVESAKLDLCTTLKKQGKGDTKIHTRITETCNDIAPNCIPQETECSKIKSDSNCNDAAACNWNSGSKVCQLKSDAKDICKKETTKKDCNDAVGCVYIGSE